MCLYAWREGHQYGLNNMEAVLHVLRNRYRAGWADWLDLLKHNGHDMPSLRDDDFRQLLQMVDLIFDGTSPDKMTEGALYYANLKEAGPEFIETISTKHEEHPRCAVVGPVYFFR